MSMHEIEGFAEQMVHLVNESNIGNDEKIDLIYNIYEFHDSWDTGFTKLRVYHILVETGYFHLFNPHEHPDYEKYKDFFDKLPESNEMYIYEDPIAGYSEDAKLTSYWFDNAYDSETDKEFPLKKMCCEAGSPVWAHFVGEEKMPKKMTLIRLFDRLTELAVDKNDIYSLGELFYFTSYTFMEPETFDEENIKCLEKMKTVLLKDDVMATLSELYLDYRIGSREDFEDDCFEDGENGQMLKEWFGYYFDWRDKQPQTKNSTFNASSNEDVLKAAADFRKMLADGEIDAFFGLFATFNMEFSALKGMFLFSDLYSSVTPEGHEKIMAYDISQTENEDIKGFVADYKEWSENKEDVSYYAKKAHDSINVEQNLLAAQYYIQKGLSIDPNNSVLKLYEIYIFMNYADDEDGNPSIKAYLDILDEILKNGLEKPELTGFAHYLKACGFYRIEEKENSKTEMKKAIEILPEYQAVYEDFFEKE